jgi:outer membrane murein-binding lipoprotein Lpp
MNQVARIFVVINLFLAAGFLMAAATFLKQNEDWRGKHGLLAKQSDETISVKDTEIAKLNAAIQGLQRDLESTRAQKSAAENDKQDAQTRLQAAETAKATADQNLQREQNNNQNHASNLEKLVGELKGLTEKVDQYHTAMMKAQEERDAANVEKTTLTTSLAAEKDQVHARDLMIEEMKKQMNEVQGKLDAYAKVYPPPAVPDQVKVEGAVTRYDPQSNVVQINRGRNQNVQLGHKFDIVRGSSFICEVEIDSVGEDYSIGHVGRVRVPGREPQAGDAATSL